MLRDSDDLNLITLQSDSVTAVRDLP